MRPSLDVAQIQEELAWVNEAVDSSRCGCRDVRCSRIEGHARSECPNAPETRIWTFRRKYMCGRCRKYEFGGSKSGLA